jgi:hypothetical protein
MTKEEKSILKVKEKLLHDLENCPIIIKNCYKCAKTPFEENLVDILIDATFNIKSKEELHKECINLK